MAARKTRTVYIQIVLSEDEARRYDQALVYAEQTADLPGRCTTRAGVARDLVRAWTDRVLIDATYG